MESPSLMFENPDFLAGFPPETYLGKDHSVASSPSPVMWPPTQSFATQPDQLYYEPSPSPGYGFPPYQSPSAMPVVEFTDLTSPFQEDRRRRRSAANDKQAISSMHMRRRAQNRASQRAFRERKEAHARDLQQRLDELHHEHCELQKSYDQLGGVNRKLLAELKELKARMTALQASQEQLARRASPHAAEGPDASAAA